MLTNELKRREGSLFPPQTHLTQIRYIKLEIVYLDHTSFGQRPLSGFKGTLGSQSQT